MMSDLRSWLYRQALKRRGTLEEKCYWHLWAMILNVAEDKHCGIKKACSCVWWHINHVVYEIQHTIPGKERGPVGEAATRGQFLIVLRSAWSLYSILPAAVSLEHPPQQTKKETNKQTPL